jgi:hypothetical protein
METVSGFMNWATEKAKTLAVSGYDAAVSLVPKSSPAPAVGVGSPNTPAVQSTYTNGQAAGRRRRKNKNKKRATKKASRRRRSN